MARSKAAWIRCVSMNVLPVIPTGSSNRRTKLRPFGLQLAYPGKTVRLRFFVCSLVSGEPRPVDCEALEWVTKEGLQDRGFPPADEQLLAALPSAPEFSTKVL